MPGREGRTLWLEQAGCLFLCASKIRQQPDRMSDAATTSRTNPGIGVDGKLTQEEWEHRRLKGLCYYCGITIDSPAPNCRNSQHPKPATVGCITFTVTGEPEVTIEEVVEGPPTESKTNTQSISTGVQPGSHGYSAHLYGCR